MNMTRAGTITHIKITILIYYNALRTFHVKRGDKFKQSKLCI